MLPEQLHHSDEGLQQTDPYTIIRQTLSSQETQFGTRFAAFADIDDCTVSHKYPHTNGPDYPDMLTAHAVPDIRVTGRHFPEVLDYINTGKITRVPDVVSSRNGTMIYIALPSAHEKQREGAPVTTADFVVDQTYQTKMRELGFDKQQLMAGAPNFFSKVKEQVPQAWLEHQVSDRPENIDTWGMVTDANQMIFDIEMPGTIDLTTAQNTIDQLAKSHYPGLSTVLMDNGAAKQSEYAGNGEAYGLFVLPENVGKDTAIAHIIEKLGIQAASYAGDQLNDLTALTASYTKGCVMYRIVVGGASPNLHNRIGHAPEQNHNGKKWRALTLHDSTKAPLFVESVDDRFGPHSVTFAVSDAIRIQQRIAQSTK